MPPPRRQPNGSSPTNECGYIGLVYASQTSSAFTGRAYLSHVKFVFWHVLERVNWHEYILWSKLVT